MSRYIAQRLLLTLCLTWGIVTLVSLMIRLAPGDAVQILLARGDPSPELIQMRRHVLGLDRPYIVQYSEWVLGLSRMNFGTSLATQRLVGPDIAKALPRTLELVGAGLVFGTIIGVPAGILAARHNGGTVDFLVSLISLGGLSVPGFVAGTVMILCFGLFLKWFPTAGYVSMMEDPAAHLRYLILPGVTLGINLAAITARFTRSSMLDVLAQEYIRTAYAKGLAHRSVRYRHALKNALIPIITVVGVESGSLLGGTVIIEYIFSWPGMSTLLIQGIDQRDYPMVQAVVLVIAVLFLIINLVTDLTIACVDPRIRYT